jgi:LemA protein
MKNSVALIAIAAFIFLYGGCKYNKLVGTDEGVKNKWGNVQSEYQRRADLIPNIVEAVKGEANFEKSVLEGVINARASATKTTIDASNLTPEKIKEVAAVQGQFGQAIGRLMSITEQYPQLKANAAFRDLSAQLEGTENRIKVARNEYNASVKDYNISVRSFPESIFASIFGFTQKGVFESDKGAEKAPSLKGAFDTKPAQ